MKYEIKIPKPCNEKWNEMTPTEKGAFCSNCQKEVFYFTNMSNYQIVKFLDNDKKLCGKIKQKQLDIDISTLENNKYSKVGLLLGLSTLLSLSTPIFGQNKSTETIKMEQLNQINEERTIGNSATNVIRIRGHVFYDNRSLAGVTVIVKGTSNGTITNFDGDFSINIDKKEINKNLILVISYIGFEKQEIKINQKTEFLKVRMIEDESVIGEVVIVKKQNIFRRIGNLFRKKENKNGQ